MVLNIVALIPARGGSKGIKGKNITPLGGKPLISYSIDTARSCNHALPTYVSTDDREIARISVDYGARVIDRPPELATDESPIISTLRHFVTVLDSKNDRPDMIVLLQPTSPLRKPWTIDRAIDAFADHFSDYDSLMPLVRLDGKIGYIKEDKYYPSAPEGARRQDIRALYKECGTVFIYKADLIRRGILNGERIFPFIIQNREEAIDIDASEDLAEAELYMRSRNE